MENRNTILNELKELAPGLAQINPVTPYQVPQAYFETLPETILLLVRAEVVSPVLTNAKQNPYQVPSNYFENLADVILNKVKALESGSIKDELEALSPLLSKLNKKSPYNIPEGYFNELPSNIADGAKAIALVNRELENLSPVMSHLKGVNVYEVPDGYFDSLSDNILSKAKEQKPAKVVSMNFGKKLMRYAAAAVVAGLMFFGGWQYFNKSTGTIEPGQLSEAEILQYLDEQNNNVIVPAVESNNDITAEDMKEMLADVSDEELQQYVEQSVTNNTVTN